MVFPIVRYRELTEWIPETDIDGIDSKESVLAVARNVDFGNGFVQSALAPQSVTYPTKVQDRLNLDSNNKVISIKHFYHQSRGHCFFYVLKDSTKMLSFFIESGSISLGGSGYTEELEIDPTGGGITWSVPDNIKIVYSYEEKQLKITFTNCSLEYINIRSVHPSFTLVSNNSTKHWGTATYDNLWIMFPRWVGWSLLYPTVAFEATTGAPLLESVFEDLSSSPYDFNGFLSNELTWSNFTILHSATPPLSEIFPYSLYLDSGNEWGYINFPVVTNVGSIEFDMYIGRRYRDTDSIKVYINRDVVSPKDEILDIREFPATLYGVQHIKFDYSFVGGSTDNIIFKVWVQTVNLGTDASPSWFRDIEIGNFTINAQPANFVIKNDDSQRCSLASSTVFPFEDSLRIKVHKYALDWRVYSFELYGKLNDTYMLAGEVDVDNSWSLMGDYYVKQIDSYSVKDSTKTLNFNYGLGATVRVDEDFGILDETLYRGRVYAVSGDEKIRQTHISGLGISQPDSFPYDEDVEFGYVKLPEVVSALGVAVSPLDELVVMTDSSNYIYYLQGGGNYILRKIKSINGGHGIINSKVIAKSLSGYPTAKVLIWSDSEGIFVYGGGRNAPINVTAIKLFNYWRNLTLEDESGNTPFDNAIGFFYKIKDEYWVCIGREIIIFELNTDSFRDYYFSFEIKEFIGSIDNVFYILGTDGVVYEIDRNQQTKRLAATVETHYTSASEVFGQYPLSAPQHDIKIMQTAYVNMIDGITGKGEMTIFADEHQVEQPIKFSTTRKTDAVLAPYCASFGKVKIRVGLPADNKVKLSEIGFEFSVPGQGLAQGFSSSGGSGGSDNQRGFGQNTGQDFGIFG